MQLIPHDLKIDFVKHRRFFVFFSTMINLAVLVGFAAFGVNWGVDFAGGSEIEIQFDKPIDAEEVRKRLASGGVPDVSLQVFGDPAEHSFLVRAPRITLLSAEGAAKVEQALRARLGETLKPGRDGFFFDSEMGEKIDLKLATKVEEQKLRDALAEAGVKVREVRDLGEAPDGFSRQVIMAGIADRVGSALADKQEKAELRRVEFVGPQVGKQLRNRGFFSLIWAMVFILGYVALRFDTRFAPGAVVALIHDVVVVLGYWVVSRREFNLTSVACLLTVVGYSINDTIVIYDRIRENLARFKGRELIATVNSSINETLSRTTITSFVTALSLGGLLVYAVGSIWDFAAAMTLGIVTGTYSSIYIASPVTLWLDDLGLRKKAATGVARAA